MTIDRYRTCSCECHFRHGIFHCAPCCTHTYVHNEDSGQKELNEILDVYGHVDNEFGSTFRYRKIGEEK